MITTDQVQKALDYLKSTDQEAARAKALVEALQESRKSVKAQCFLESDGKSNQAKEAEAYSNPMYLAHLEKLENAIMDFETLKNRRKSAELQIMLFSTTFKYQQQGNIY